MFKKIVRIVLISGTIVYSIICILFYFNQKKLLFHPESHPPDYSVEIQQPFEELNIPVSDGININSLLIKTDSASKGLIFYIHGNGGTIFDRVDQAAMFTEAGYDFFMPEYREYGKSGGVITSEDQIFSDFQHVYNEMLNRYPAEKIILLGYSLGSGFATRLAAINHCKRLVLLAPYYSITFLKNEHYPIIPSFLIKYKIETFRYLPECEAPVTIFHGKSDGLIPPESSVKLAEKFKPADQLILLPDQEHNGIPWNEEYQEKMVKLLNE